MSIHFNGSDEYLKLDAAPVNDEAFTMVCWANHDTGTIASPGETLLGIWDASAGSGDGFSIGVTVTDNYPVCSITASGSGASDEFLTAITAGEWFHIAGVYRLANDREVYVDGVSGGGNGSTRNPTSANMDVTVVGAAAYASIIATHWDGHIAHAAIYNTDLSVGEIQALAAGMSPLRIRPENLVMYWPLDAGELKNVIDGQYHQTAYGAPPAGTINPPVGPVYGYETAISYVPGDTSETINIGKDTIGYSGKDININARTQTTIVKDTVSYVEQSLSVNARENIQIVKKNIIYGGKVVETNATTQIDVAKDTIAYAEGELTLAPQGSTITIGKDTIAYSGKTLYVETNILIPKDDIVYDGKGVADLTTDIIPIGKDTLVYSGGDFHSGEFKPDEFNGSEPVNFWWTKKNNTDQILEQNNRLEILNGSGDVYQGTFDITRLVQKVSGDFDTAVKLTAPDIDAHNEQAGIVFEVDSNNHIGIFYRFSNTGSRNLHFQRRDTVAAATYFSSTAIDSGASPCWLRIKRVSNTFTTYYSTSQPTVEGDWTAIPPVDSTLTSSVNGDLGVCSAYTGRSDFDYHSEWAPFVEISKDTIAYSGKDLVTNAREVISIAKDTIAYVGKAAVVTNATIIYPAKDTIAYAGKGMFVTDIVPIPKDTISYTGKDVTDIPVSAILDEGGFGIQDESGTYIEDESGTLTAIDLNKDTIAYAGKALTVNARSQVAIAKDTIVYAEKNLFINAGFWIPGDDIAYIPGALNTKADEIIIPTKDTIAYSGKSITANIMETITIGKDTIVYAGKDNTIKFDEIIFPVKDIVVYSDKNLIVLSGDTVIVGKDTIAYSGQSTTTNIIQTIAIGKDTIAYAEKNLVVVEDLISIIGLDTIVYDGKLTTTLTNAAPIGLPVEQRFMFW